MKKSKYKLNLDELNKLNSLDRYYDPMQIDIGSKQRRRELAEYLADAFLFFFSTFEVHGKYNSLLTKQLYSQLLSDRVAEAVTKVTGIDDYMSNHIREMSKEVVNTTFKNANKSNSSTSSFSTGLPDDKYTPNTYSSKPLDHSKTTPKATAITLTSGGPTFQEEDDDYWLSYRRAEDIAKSEANTFLNYTDYVEAKERGATHKRWLTMLDDKVRQTHSEVEGATVGIDESFQVGNSLMRFPHDLSESPDPKEVIGCRCAVEYL